MKRTIVSLTLLLACAALAFAELPDTRAHALLTLADTPAVLRGLLMAYADSAATAGDQADAAEALSYAGTSFQREGRIDSAIVCHRRALDLSPTADGLIALVDQLLVRRGPGDAAEVASRIDSALAQSELTAPAPLMGRLAWARFEQGMTDSAHTLFAPVARRLEGQSSEWRYRLGRVALERRQYRRAVDLLLPVAVRSRGTDDDVVGLLEKAGDELGMTKQLRQEVRRRVEDGDRPVVALAQQLGGRLVALSASDGFPLGGMLVPAATSARATARLRPLLAVVLLAPGDTLASADSLVTALRRHSITTLLLYPRGSGASVGPPCPSPEAWFDREVLLQSRVAADIRDVAHWARRNLTVDTTRYVVAGAGPSAAIAVEAAVLDPRVKALLLVSPAPAAVDRGATRARLARLQLPVFFQVAPDDFTTSFWITDVLYQAGNRAASRVAESQMSGQGLAQFRDDGSLAPRFLAWLDATLSLRRPATTRRTTAPVPPPTRPGSRPRE